MKTALWFGVFFAVLAIGLFFLVQNKRGPFVVEDPQSTQVTTGVIVPLYYYQQSADVDANGNSLCSQKGLVRVLRKLPEGNTLEDRVNLLLTGELTAAEKAAGISTEYPLVGLTLKNVEIHNRKAVLTFEDTLNKTVGGSCRTSILWYQIEKTVLADPDIRDVEFLPKTLFQP